MGVLRQGAYKTACKANALRSKANYLRSKTGDFVNAELGRTRVQVTQILRLLPELGLEPLIRTKAEIAGANITNIISNIQSFRSVAWTQEKLFTLFSQLMKSVEEFVGFFGAHVTTVTTPAAAAVEPLIAALKDAFEKIATFVTCTFDKLDDSLVTPVVMTTVNGIQTSYTLSTDFVYAQANWVSNNFVFPVTSTVNSQILTPLYKKVTDTARCTTSGAIYAGALLDSKFSLVGCMLALVDKSKQMDECVTKGAITNKVVLPAIASAKTLDKKFASGAFDEFISSSIDEFQAAKAENINNSTHTKTNLTATTATTTAGVVVPGNFTSAGAPVLRRK